MLKKIVFICLFVLSIDVSAKEIVIDDKVYDDSQSIEGDGFRFDHENNLIYLDNYDGGSIIYDGDLTIILRNENTIACDSYSEGIKGNMVTIKGNGLLSVRSDGIGILCQSLYLSNVSLKVEARNVGIKITRNKLDLSYANLIIEAKAIAIFVNREISSHHSKINVLMGDIGASSIVEFKFLIYGSTVYFQNISSLMNCSSLDVEDSNVLINGKIGKVNFVNHDENNLYDSTDGEEFVLVDSYRNNPYLLITNKEISNFTRDEMLIKAEDFIIKEEVLTENEYYTDGFDLPTNPNTYDNILSYFLMFIFSMVILVMLRRIYVRTS